MMKLLIICLFIVTWQTDAMHVTSDEEKCEQADCRAGRECVIIDNMAQCLCALTCPDHFKPVCGTDGESYENHCLLHRHACITGEHISVQHKGFCKKSLKESLKKDVSHAKMSRIDLQENIQHDLLNGLRKDIEKEALKQKSQVPAVCYSYQRDSLRYLLVAYWEEKLKAQPWYVEGMTYRESLWGWFYACDSDKDNHLTPDEMAKCSRDSPFFARADQDEELTKVLCIDALVDDGDSNHDWRLDFEEFTTIMDPKYIPKKKQCSLEGKKYDDGNTIRVYCNHCICAVGNWVCASQDCHSKTSDKDSFGYADGRKTVKEDDKRLQHTLDEDDYYDELVKDTDEKKKPKHTDQKNTKGNMKVEDVESKNTADNDYLDDDYGIDEILFKNKGQQRNREARPADLWLDELIKRNKPKKTFVEEKKHKDVNKKASQKKLNKKELVDNDDFTESDFDDYMLLEKLKKKLHKEQAKKYKKANIENKKKQAEKMEEKMMSSLSKSKDNVDKEELWKFLLETNKYNEDHKDLWSEGKASQSKERLRGSTSGNTF